MPDKRAQFTRRVQRLIGRIDRLDNQARGRAAVLLRDLKSRLDQVVVATDFERFQGQNVKVAVSDLADDFMARYGDELDAASATVLELQRDFQNELRDVGTRGDGVSDLGTPVISPTQLAVAQNFRADLIRGMRDKIVTDVSREINLGVLAGDSPRDVQNRIARFITPRRRPDGTSGGALGRAEVIARTEVNRVFNIANRATQERDAELLKSRGIEARKVWVTAGDFRVRASHLEAGRRYKVGGDPGPIPINEPFQLRDKNGAFQPLMFPQDPAGPPELTIQCRCQSVTVTADIVELAR